MTPKNLLAALAAVLLFSAHNSIAQVLFSDNFDLDTSANWTINQTSTDTAATFAYDYSAMGIPSAPNSIGGTTLGLKLEANNIAPASGEAISVSPIGQSFTGDYSLRFDMWININGPFPGGGAGSTLYLSAGIGTTGTNAQWTGAGSTADGAWFAVDGEGGAAAATSADFRAHRSGALQTVGSGTYAAGATGNPRDNTNAYYTATFPGGQTAPASQIAAYPGPGAGTNQTGALAIGTVGFAWRDVVITKLGNDVIWSIDGLTIATLTNAVLAGDNIFVGFYDIFTTSITDNPAVSFGVVDNLRVVPEPSTVALGAVGAASLLLLRRRKT
jgi:PEP-CTERM motif-containing protein